MLWIGSFFRKKSDFHCTMTVPFMDGWIEQWYVYVPGWANVKE
jgi:hypothetical protein